MEFIGFHQLKLYRQEVKDLILEQDTWLSGVYVQARKLGRVPSKDEVTARLAAIQDRLRFIQKEIDQRSYRVFGDNITFTGD